MGSAHPILPSEARSSILEALRLAELSKRDRANAAGSFPFRLMQDQSASVILLSHFRDGDVKSLDVDEISEEGYQRYLVTASNFGRVCIIYYLFILLEISFPLLILWTYLFRSLLTSQILLVTSSLNSKREFETSFFTPSMRVDVMSEF